MELWTPTAAEVIDEVLADTAEVLEGEIVDETLPEESTTDEAEEALEDETGEGGLFDEALKALTAGQPEETPQGKVKGGKHRKPFVLTPYQATKIFNQARVDAGLGTVNSPFMYIQAGKGKFPVGHAADGRMEITDIEAFVNWMNEHNLRQLRIKAAKATADANKK
jgi:hypothetical protein